MIGVSGDYGQCEKGQLWNIQIGEIKLGPAKEEAEGRRPNSGHF